MPAPPPYEPTTTLLPEIATERPNRCIEEGSGLGMLACRFQCPADPVKMYATPPFLAKSAPITIVLPEMATAVPKFARSRFGSGIRPTWCHPLVVRARMKAFSWNGLPITAVDPEMATDQPNPSTRVSGMTGPGPAALAGAGARTGTSEHASAMARTTVLGFGRSRWIA